VPVVLSALYAAAVRRRREFYSARPDLRKRLRRPVISVGNLAVGGRGKTPTVACLARELLALGERPAILSRGYGRRQQPDGVVVVRDATGIRADLDRSGDEPLMLARQLDGVAVLASPDRYLAGCIAERHLGATVHLLDDGFQHLQLDRDIDLVLVSAEDLDANALTLPAGRLREPVDTLVAADAVLMLGGSEDRRLADSGGQQVFRMRRSLGLAQPAPAASANASERSLAVAGIARPDAFFDGLRAAGHEIVASRSFRDHHRYSRGDLEGIVTDARARGATRILTTEKDYVRLLPFRPFALPIAWVPLTMEPDPLPEFRRWLVGALAAARDLWPDPVD
jgi:tetraacyldisaccharide 4'-kinase